MTDHIYRLTDLVGTSTESVEAAIGNALRRASQSIEGLDWFEVVQIRGHLVDGALRHYQVELKIGSRIAEDA